MVNAKKHKQMKAKALRLKGRNDNGTFKQKYKNKRDTQIKITTSANFRDAVKQLASHENKSMTEYIIDAIKFYSENH